MRRILSGKYNPRSIKPVRTQIQSRRPDKIVQVQPWRPNQSFCSILLLQHKHKERLCIQRI
jgi:hypothetical protein